MRHLDMRDLWLRMEVGKVRGDQNPADVMTKYLPCWSSLSERHVPVCVSCSAWSSAQAEGRLWRLHTCPRPRT